MHQQKIWAMHFNLQARKFDSRSSLGHAVHSLLFLHLASSYWNLFRKFERQLMTAKYFYEKELVLMTVESWVAYSDNMYVVFWAGSMSGLVTRLMFDDGGGWCHLYTRFRHGCHIKEWWRRDRCRWQCWNIDVIIVNRDHSDGRIPNNTRNWEHVWLQLRWGYCQEDASQMQLRWALGVVSDDEWERRSSLINPRQMGPIFYPNTFMHVIIISLKELGLIQFIGINWVEKKQLSRWGSYNNIWIPS